MQRGNSGLLTQVIRSIIILAMELLISLPQLFIIIGLLLILAELFIGIQTGFDLVLIGSILIISGFTGIATESTPLMLALASGLSIAYIFIGRNKIRQKITVITKKTNIDKLIGMQGLVVRSITPDTPGLVRLNDEDWRAVSHEVIFEKESFEVVAIEGVSLVVKKVKK